MRGHYHSTDDTADALKVIQTIIEMTLVLMGSRQSIQEHDTLTNFGCLPKQFNPNTLLDKFLHRLINDKIIGENIVQVHVHNLAVYIKLEEKAQNSPTTDSFTEVK